MKTLKNILAWMFIVALVAGCNDGIDPISHVAPGPDEKDPTVSITFPGEGGKIRIREDVGPVTIRFEAIDDIEIESATIVLDGSEIAKLTEFKDYRHVLSEYQYATLANGPHSLQITVVDPSGKSASTSVNFEKVEPYKTKYPGEVFYMPFDGDYLDLVQIKEATKVGVPSFSNTSVLTEGKSYQGATNSYLTFPTKGLLTGKEFSASFWYKTNATPDRAGILIVGAPDAANVDKPHNLTKGFRFFREGGPTNQTFKLHVGFGKDGSWFDGGPAATIDPTAAGWKHMAFTISATECAVYIDGVLVKKDPFQGVDWAGCDIISIASGAPRFLGWDHKSDLSNMDELRLFNKALTQAEVQAVMNGD